MKRNPNRAGLVVTALAGAALALVACTGETAPETATPVSETTSTTPAAPEGALQPQKMWEREHKLRNGETVTCLYVQDSGLSCDWTGAVEYGGEK